MADRGNDALGQAVANAAAAMGIDWMTKHELNEAIPPAYTEHLGLQLAAHIRALPANDGAALKQTGEAA